MSTFSQPISLLRRFNLWSGWNSNLAGYALRTALASCFALFLGWVLGLEHPQWAAMSVWAASQPQKKGMLFEKSLFRVFGTVIGTIVGILILSLSDGNILFIGLSLTIWITLCTGAGNLMNGLFSYLTLLSGYTASLVSLLKVAQGADIYALGLDRMLTVLVGVIIATIVGAIFNKASSEELMTIRVKQLTGAVLRLFIQSIHSPVLPDQVAELIKEAALIDEQLEPHGAGSVRSRRSVHSIRAILHANITLLTRLSTKSTMEHLRPIEKTLQKLSSVVTNDFGLKAELYCIREIRSQLNDSELVSCFNDLHTALSERLRYKSKGKIEKHSLRHMLVLHRDWIAARQAMCRTFIILGSISSIWFLSDSPVGAFVMLGTSVMVTLFSTFESPTLMMQRIFFWQSIGLVASLITKGYLWTYASSELEYILIMVVVMLPVIIPLSTTRFSMGAMDYVMIYLLLAHIQYPIDFNFNIELTMGLAAIGGTFVAYLAFLLIFPTNPAKRSSRIKAAILQDLYHLYHINWDYNKFAFIHSRAQHRLLRLIQSDSRLKSISNEQISGVITILATIQIVGKIKEMLASDSLTEMQRDRISTALVHQVSLIITDSDQFDNVISEAHEYHQSLTYLYSDMTP